MEDNITFLSDNYVLHGLFEKNSLDKGVVVTHPHSLYGGDMYNYVVEAIVHTYKKKGYATLRFNFRGVGKSQGHYDNGTGEQTDVLSAISFLNKQGISGIELAGYSFGTWVYARTDLSSVAVKKMIMVSPPVAFMDFTPVSPIPCLDLVVAGTEDDFAPVSLIKETLPRWNPDARLEVIDGADHFYMGYLQELEGILLSAFSQ